MEESEIKKYEGKPVYASGQNYRWGMKGVVHDGIFLSVSIEDNHKNNYHINLIPIKSEDIMSIKKLEDKASTLELSVSRALQDRQDKVKVSLPLIKEL